MRASIALAAAIAGLFLAVPSANASPYQPLVQYEKQSSKRNASLELRQGCANPCGWHDQYCCESNQQCITTTGDIATCIAGGGSGGGGGGGGGWHMFTTTFVIQGPTTVTSTGSFMDAQTPAPGGSPAACPQGKSQCGAVCCGSGQTCAQPGRCVDGTGSAFIRPTSDVTSTAIETGAATTIIPLGTSVPTGEPSEIGPSQGLSPGAIAGIVIGVLLGLFILFIILACLCCKGIIDGILTLFGCRKKRRVEETTIIEEHHSHHGSHRPQRTWFGMVRPGRTEVEVKKKKSSGVGGLLGAGAFLGTLAIILGLKRRHDRKSEKDDNSYGSVSYYSYEDDYTTSASSASSDRRSRSHRGSRRETSEIHRVRG